MVYPKLYIASTINTEKDMLSTGIGADMLENTDKRTDVWSRNFLIWKINFGLGPGLDCGKKGSGPILSNFFGWFFQFFMGKKKFFLNFFYIVASALKSCIK